MTLILSSFNIIKTMNLKNIFFYILNIINYSNNYMICCKIKQSILMLMFIFYLNQIKY